jgi:hypothetical protein
MIMDYSKAILPSMETRDLGNGLSANVDEHGTICLTTSDGKHICLEASTRIALAQYICEVLLAQTKAEQAITDQAQRPRHD